MNKLFLVAAIAALFFASCATQRNAEKYYREHPEKLAEKCAQEFPIKDSIGQPVIDSVKKGDNIDYSPAIDSTNKAAQDLINKIKAYQAKEVDSLKANCLDVIGDLNKRALDLEGQVRRLRANYKPCDPDTVFTSVPVYRENTAKVAAQEFKIKELEEKLAKSDAEKDRWRSEARKRWWIIAALLALIGVGIYLRIRRIL